MTWKFELVAGPYKGRTGGLAWDGKGMLFSAVQEERILRFDPATGKTEVFRKYTGRTNGIAIATDGTVFGAQEGGRRVIHFPERRLDRADAGTARRRAPQPARRRRGRQQGTRLDRRSVQLAAAVRPAGLPDSRRTRRCCAWTTAVPGSGSLTRVTHDTLGPRAVLLSADEKTLYVADGDVERGDVCQLLAYPVNAHGSAGHCKALLTFTAVERGIEGMCLDSDGNIVACVGWKKSGAGAAIVVISPAGTILETHPAPADMPMRCAFGDADLRSLYVTAGDGGLYRAKGVGRRGLKR